jgi:hypothetical protein
MTMKKATDEALEVYNREMLDGHNELDMCLNVKELEAAHARAVSAACAALGRSLATPDGYEDTATPALRKVPALFVSSNRSPYRRFRPLLTTTLCYNRYLLLTVEIILL